MTQEEINLLENATEYGQEHMFLKGKIDNVLCSVLKTMDLWFFLIYHLFPAMPLPFPIATSKTFPICIELEQWVGEDTFFVIKTS